MGLRTEAPVSCSRRPSGTEADRYSGAESGVMWFGGGETALASASLDFFHLRPRWPPPLKKTSPKAVENPDNPRGVFFVARSVDHMAEEQIDFRFRLQQIRNLIPCSGIGNSRSVATEQHSPGER